MRFLCHPHRDPPAARVWPHPLSSLLTHAPRRNPHQPLLCLHSVILSFQNHPTNAVRPVVTLGAALFTRRRPLRIHPGGCCSDSSVLFIATSCPPGRMDHRLSEPKGIWTRGRHLGTIADKAAYVTTYRVLCCPHKPSLVCSGVQLLSHIVVIYFGFFFFKKLPNHPGTEKKMGIRGGSQ